MRAEEREQRGGGGEGRRRRRKEEEEEEEKWESEENQTTSTLTVGNKFRLGPDRKDTGRWFGQTGSNQRGSRSSKRFPGTRGNCVMICRVASGPGWYKGDDDDGYGDGCGDGYDGGDDDDVYTLTRLDDLSIHRAHVARWTVYVQSSCCGVLL